MGTAGMNTAPLDRLMVFTGHANQRLAQVVANMLTSVGVARVLTMDLHADQIQGFFDLPVDNIYAAPVLLGDVWKQRYDNLLVVSPDVGGVVRARALAKRLESDLAIID